MFTVYYTVENAWGTDVDEIGTFATMDEAIAEGKKNFSLWKEIFPLSDEDWWVENAEGDVVYDENC
jgi:hypothetical protein